MSNFSIFHVPLPGNVEISSQIMKPFISFNMIKDIHYMNFGKEASIDDGEEALAFLGQRSTFNYNTFNVMYNTEALGICLILFFIKGIMIVGLWLF